MTSIDTTSAGTKNFDSTSLDFSKAASSTGLIPAVVTHAITGQVLMVAWCNKAAVDHTLATGKVTFYSRSRQELWTKGDTSGNTLTLRSMVSDCDNDTLLISALPSGPVCHTGTSTCFDAQPESSDGSNGTSVNNIADLTPGNFLHQLEQIIAARAVEAAATETDDEANSSEEKNVARGTATKTSYTAKLLQAGVARIAQKVGEEGVEVALAGVQKDREHLKDESADLLYHLLVLLKANDLALSDVLAELQSRHMA